MAWDGMGGSEVRSVDPEGREILAWNLIFLERLHHHDGRLPHLHNITPPPHNNYLIWAAERRKLLAKSARARSAMAWPTSKSRYVLIIRPFSTYQHISD
jgi:hypothetical protein